MEVRNLFRLPQAFRGCLRNQSSPSKTRRHLSSTPQFSAGPPPASSGAIGGLGVMGRNLGGKWSKDIASDKETRSLEDWANDPNASEYPRQEEHHLHVFATKHNCHVTLSSPTYLKDGKVRRDNIISLSSGNIGFRKSARGTYDAGFQLGSYMMSRIQDRGLLKDIQKLELVMRGHGPGREAISKILLGIEGNNIRDKVIRVVDATRLKFGGTRSRKPRRLG